MFPYETIPDGSVAVSHHATWALVLALIPLMHVWDNDPEESPWPAVTAIVVTLLSFLLVWPTHHVLGAGLALVANISAVGLLSGELAYALWVEHRGSGAPLWGPVPLALAFLLALVALDDIAQHALGLQTPLDMIWKTELRPRLPSH